VYTNPTRIRITLSRVGVGHLATLALGGIIIKLTSVAGDVEEKKYIHKKSPTCQSPLMKPKLTFFPHYILRTEYKKDAIGIMTNSAIFARARGCNLAHCKNIACSLFIFARN
jgi:hypothetical protein